MVERGTVRLDESMSVEFVQMTARDWNEWLRAYKAGWGDSGPAVFLDWDEFEACQGHHRDGPAGCAQLPLFVGNIWFT
jgi:hypothetical protein